LVLLTGPDQANDSPMFNHLRSQLRIDRAGPGRPRNRPERFRGDKAYSCRAIRSHLRDRGIIVVIPEPSDQIGHRKRRGNAGGRPPRFDAHDYRTCHVVECNFNASHSATPHHDVPAASIGVLTLFAKCYEVCGTP
jgi:hypothetical protein